VNERRRWRRSSRLLAICHLRSRVDPPPGPGGIWIQLDITWTALRVVSLRVPGPVSAFDSGLYQMSSIKQVREFGTLLGEANLYPPYGYHNSLFAFAGFLTEATVGDQGYRLTNAFLLLLGLLDLFTRLIRRSKALGTILLTSGLGMVVLLTVPLADEWIISPSPDTAAFVLYLVMLRIWSMPSQAGHEPNSTVTSQLYACAAGD